MPLHYTEFDQILYICPPLSSSAACWCGKLWQFGEVTHRLRWHHDVTTARVSNHGAAGHGCGCRGNGLLAHFASRPGRAPKCAVPAKRWGIFLLQYQLCHCTPPWGRPSPFFQCCYLLLSSLHHSVICSYRGLSWMRFNIVWLTRTSRALCFWETSGSCQRCFTNVHSSAFDSPRVLSPRGKMRDLEMEDGRLSWWLPGLRETQLQTQSCFIFN